MGADTVAQYAVPYILGHPVGVPDLLGEGKTMCLVSNVL